MNVAMHGRVTSQDVVRVERIKDDVSSVQEKVDALRDCLMELIHTRLPSAQKVMESGARRFAKHDESSVGELRREIALARAHLQQEHWSAWWEQAERKLADVEAAFAELRVRQQLGLALDCCSE